MREGEQEIGERGEKKGEKKKSERERGVDLVSDEWPRK